MDSKNSNHIYTNSNGVLVPSVTTILTVLNKPGLVEWSNYIGLRNIKYEEYMEERASIGTDFHKMVEDYMNNREVNGVHYKEAIELFNRFVNWTKCHYYTTFLTEQTLVGHSYGGTFDAIGEIDGVLTLVDYKTSKKHYPSFFVQLAGYAGLLEELMPDTYEKIKAFGVLTMRATVPYVGINKKDLLDKYMPVFKDALHLYLSWHAVLEETVW